MRLCVTAGVRDSGMRPGGLRESGSRGDGEATCGALAALLQDEQSHGPSFFGLRESVLKNFVPKSRVVLCLSKLPIGPTTGLGCSTRGPEQALQSWLLARALFLVALWDAHP